jgi:hypothetical protein
MGEVGGWVELVARQWKKGDLGDCLGRLILLSLSFLSFMSRCDRSRFIREWTEFCKIWNSRPFCSYTHTIPFHGAVNDYKTCQIVLASILNQIRTATFSIKLLSLCDKIFVSGRDFQMQWSRRNTGIGTACPQNVAWGAEVNCNIYVTLSNSDVMWTGLVWLRIGTGGENKNSMVWVRERTIPTERLPTCADRGCHMVSVTDSSGRILSVF